MGETFHIVEDGGSRGGKSRHCLEVGIRKTVDVTADYEGQRAEETEDNPGERNHEVGITARHCIVGSMTSPFQYQSASDGGKCSHDEGKDVVLLIVESYQQTDEEQECLDEEELS